MKIYLDACCYNRLFDDQTQDRISMESKAITLVLKRVDLGQLNLISSEVLEYEINNTNDVIRKANMILLLAKNKYCVNLINSVINRGFELEKLGFHPYDALHIASAEQEKVDTFLTTDDMLLKKARKNKSLLKTRVLTPIEFIKEILL